MSMRQMCSTCMLEGGYFPLGVRNSILTTLLGISLLVIGRKYIMLALKLKTANVNGLLKIINISSTYQAAGKTGAFELQLHSTVGSVGNITGSLNYIQLSSSIAQYATGDGTQYIAVGQDGYILTGGFISSRTVVDFNSNDYETLLTRTNCTKYDTIYLIGIGNTSNDVMFSSMDFIEGE